MVYPPDIHNALAISPSHVGWFSGGGFLTFSICLCSITKADTEIEKASDFHLGFFIIIRKYKEVFPRSLSSQNEYAHADAHSVDFLPLSLYN